MVFINYILMTSSSYSLILSFSFWNHSWDMQPFCALFHSSCNSTSVVFDYVQNTEEDKEFNTSFIPLTSPYLFIMPRLLKKFIKIQRPNTEMRS